MNVYRKDYIIHQKKITGKILRKIIQLLSLTYYMLK